MVEIMAVAAVADLVVLFRAVQVAAVRCVLCGRAILVHSHQHVPVHLNLKKQYESLY
jgi:hypothetical protein